MIAQFGSDVGTVITWSLCGILIETFGWQYAFYVPGLIVALFAILWFFLVYDSPAKHPRILEKERSYILKTA